jgi:hypothetical protein
MSLYRVKRWKAENDAVILSEDVLDLYSWLLLLLLGSDLEYVCLEDVLGLEVTHCFFGPL